MYNRQRIGGNGLLPTHMVGGYEQLEDQNTAAVGELCDKVGVLTSIARQIGKVVNEDIIILNNTDETFERAKGLIDTTIGNVKKLAKPGYRYYRVYLFVFSLFVFTVLWLYI